MPHLRALAVLAIALLSSSGAVALTAAEEATLARGETVEHREVREGGRGRYVGGLTYTVIDASPEELDPLFEDVSTYPRILPHTKAAILVGRERGDLLVWLRQGNALLDASYTVRIRPDDAGPAQGRPRGARTVRFWVDLSRPHGIEDARGFFRYEPLPGASPGEPRVLLTYGIWVDVGPGIVRTFFEERIQRIVLSVPQRLRAYVGGRNHRG